jgi:site-specific recombinase XerD
MRSLKATAEDVHRYQLWLVSIGTTVPTVNAGASALRFFFRVTLKRRDLADAVVWVREPRRLPVVLSSEEVGRLLASTPVLANSPTDRFRAVRLLPNFSGNLG